MKLPNSVRWSRFGLALVAPLLVAAECNDPVLQIESEADQAFLGRRNVIRVSVKNTGESTAILGTITAADLGLAPPFVLGDHTCTTGRALAKSESCYLGVEFQPTDFETYADTIELRYGWGDGSDRRVATHAIRAAAAPYLFVMDQNQFGVHAPGTWSEHVISVRNDSPIPVRVDSFGAGGVRLDAPFHIASSTCSGALAPHASCTITVGFRPTRPGQYDDAFTIDYSWLTASGARASYMDHVAVSGTSVLPVIVTGQHYLPPTFVGSAQVRTYRVHNPSSYAVTLGTITTAGLGLAAPLVVTGGTCRSGAALAANGGFCDIEVQFTAATAGITADELTLRYFLPGVTTPLLATTRITANAVAPSSNDCLQTGCAEGQVCTDLGAAGGSTCVPVPTPLPKCMAPCLWQARKKCLPVLGACSTQTLHPGEPNQTHVTCDPQTRWAIAGMGATTAYRREGDVCFSRTGVSSSSPDPSAAYSDGSQPIATSITQFSMSFNLHIETVWCGAYATPDDVPSGAPSYQRDFYDAECNAWENAYLAQTQCRTQSPGSCSGL